MELRLYHPSGSQDFEVISTFLKTLGTPVEANINNSVFLR
jgi:hypothetical protein